MRGPYEVVLNYGQEDQRVLSTHYKAWNAVLSFNWKTFQSHDETVELFWRGWLIASPTASLAECCAKGRSQLPVEDQQTIERVGLP